MMKIHTTQDLKPLVQNNSQSTNSVSFRDFRLKNYSEQMLMPKVAAEKLCLADSSISFRGKQPLKNVTKIIRNKKQAVGDVKKKANPEMKRGDKFLTGSFFNALLSISKYETVVQAAIAAVICMVIRPATIMAIPTKKSKEDNIYASSHSIASGLVGLIATFLLTTPFKMGADYVTKNMLKELKESALKRLFPQLDLKSIVDRAGKRVDVENWLNNDGKKFCKEIKDVMKLPEFNRLSDVSEQTFEKVLGIKDVDWAAQKGKSFNDVVLKDGSKFYDKVNMSRMGIIVHEEGMNNAQILLKDLDREYLTQLIKDAPKDSNWSKLDINSVYDNNNVVDFRKWKDTTGKQWKLDLDTVYVSSPYETASYKPRITGNKTYHERDKVYKFTTYQKNNNIDLDTLGTAITKEMIEAESRNEGHMKLLTWFPDLIFRIPIAATTIALIPIILKNVFGVEKSKKKDNKQVQLQTATVPAQQNIEKVNFKAKGKPSNNGNWFKRAFGKWYGKPLLENERVAKWSEKLSKLPGSVTQHMATLGSFITSSVYVQRTMTNKDLDPDRRRTLAINQTLCFFIPTVAAYTVDHALKNWTKKQEYRYSGWQEHKEDIAKLEGKILNEKEIQKELGTKLKGVRILSSLVTFTLIYRYATPVIITPIANWLGDKLNAKKRAQQEAKELALNSDNNKETAKEIALNPNYTNNSKAKEISINNTDNNYTRKTA